VTLGKIKSRLRREMAANPKKAALLGLVTVVALYFWGPLIWGWLNQGEKNPVAAVPTTPASDIGQFAAVPANLSTDAPQKASTPSREQILQWMHDDPRMATAPPRTKARDPFEDPKSEAANVKTEKKVKPPPPITPAAAGLVLTSTIIGPKRSIAQISGRTYVVGQTIEINKDKEAVRAAFRLEEIHSRRAILESRGIRFELTIPGADKSGKIEFLNRD